jgi:OOP family OmpA-OmpF porin
MKRVLISALLASTLAVPAFAADKGPFVALDLQSWSATNTFPFGDPGIGLRIGGGYHFMPYFGVEVDYAKSGDSASVGGGSYSVSSFQAAAVGTLPINPMFDLYAKLGLASNTVGGAVCSASCSKTDLMFGFGGQFNINKQVGIRLEYDDLGHATDSGVDDIAVSTISVGVVYNF